MRTPFHLWALRFGTWLGNRRVPVIPNLIAKLVWGEWLCRVRGHKIVPRLPVCWRCDASWSSWEQVEK